MSINLVKRMVFLADLRVSYFYFIAFFLFFTPLNTKAQTNSGSIEQRLAPKLIGTVYQKSHNYPGTELLFSNWQKGSIILNDNTFIENLWLNYDAFSDNLLYKYGNDEAVVVSKYQVKAFIINDGIKQRRFEQVNNSSDTDEYPQFLEVLYNGRIKLYAKRSLKINNNLVKENPFGESVYYSTNEYIMYKDGSKTIVQQNKLFFNAHFGKPITKSIIRKNNLSIKNELDLIEIFRLLDKV